MNKIQTGSKMMIKEADISVILPIYNGEKYLRDCIESIINQSTLPKEILIIDDGSIDNSAAIALQYPQLRYQKILNKGVANARNIGLEMASFDWIAFIDQDDLWTPNSLKSRMLALENSKQAKIVIGRQKWFLDGMDSPPSWVKKEQMQDSLDGYLLGCSLIHKDLFKLYGTFNASFRFASDFDWLFRLKDADEYFHQVEDIVLEKRIHEMNESRHAKASLAELTKAIYQSVLRKRTKNQ
ncbi:MAG: glycosyltransferase involved in cell wall biosynthesis [Sediminicola sp.]|jgi:glycosyltransferase involved in cell wall biosynthesis|tara:strand:+ start:718 stop:1437 length:720 start_codon:yes stop_codon:yes gene_type:complete